MTGTTLAPPCLHDEQRGSVLNFPHALGSQWRSLQFFQELSTNMLCSRIHLRQSVCPRRSVSRGTQSRGTPKNATAPSLKPHHPAPPPEPSTSCTDLPWFRTNPRPRHCLRKSCASSDHLPPVSHAHQTSATMLASHLRVPELFPPTCFLAGPTVNCGALPLGSPNHPDVGGHPGSAFSTDPRPALQREASSSEHP